ncbi:alpha/beta hydrolase [Phaeocystidibacter luteus]|uniref:Alpha/beta hydrolase n=1 Tax=Phaeocystidibacter luteus TaxID=911197 RepID=A0A6N6RLK2_9FLAO|nr:alpha/beta fold hydrolase [Phaeocystidibacter luteus]KAB2814455.1 alpha/beta hydrolase [Phaeocystidibacter luteus]
MKAKHYFLLLLVILVVVYLSGPTPDTPNYSGTVVRNIDAENLLTKSNLDPKGVKEGNETLLRFSGQATPYSILYLHGFSASPEEGNPVHSQLYEHFGYNLVAPRLYAHGLVTDNPLMEFRADSAWHSAVRGLEKALAIGDSVIVVSTSTGGALATRLAQLDSRIAALVYYSPNVMPNDGAAFLLNDPWGEQIARMVLNSNFRDLQISDPYYEKFWYRYYRVESLPEMQELVETGFDEEAVRSIHVPVMVACWYESEEKQDDAVSVPHMREFYSQLDVPNKQFIELAANSHVIANGRYSSVVRELTDTTIHFLTSNGFMPVAKDTTAP